MMDRPSDKIASLTQDDNAIEGPGKVADPIEKKKGIDWKRYHKLFAVKPVLILFSLQYQIALTLILNLSLQRACKVNLGFNETVCDNLNDKKYEDQNTQVQQLVVTLANVDGLIAGIPAFLMAIYLGPWCDKGRKPLMILPFLGYFAAEIMFALNLFFDDWPVQCLWLVNVYVLGGGGTVLHIAMNAYIGDVTNESERFTVMALLAGIGLLITPLAEFIGGQVYKAWGYYPIIGLSFTFTILGILYVLTIPESVAKENRWKETRTDMSLGKRLKHMFHEGNRQVVDCFRTAWIPRPTRKFLFATMGLNLLLNVSKSTSFDFFFAQKIYHWDVVTYVNFNAVMVLINGARTFITTPIMSYWLKMPDCFLAILGSMTSANQGITVGLSTKGWHMYFATALTFIAPIGNMAFTSILSKCVDRSEFGKIFTLNSIIDKLIGLIAKTGSNSLYAATVAIYPGIIFFVLAAFDWLCVGLTAMLWYHVTRYEQANGRLGIKQKGL